MNCGPEYWIWLQRALGAGAVTDEIVRFFGNAEKVYEAGRNQWLESGLFTDKMCKALISCSPSESYRTMKMCEDNGWVIITPDDEKYPPMLRSIRNFPLVLYVQGDTDVLTCPFSIGIVGTRDASSYGTDVAEAISFTLAEAGCVVVSGGALGIDSRAHEGAIRAGGKTIAFLGSGLGSDYLKSNEALRETIAENGALVSEFAPFSSPSRSTFPIRNRLISGMTQGLVVVEAGVHSGSLITAKCAAQQGRDIFAVPGNILNTGYLGTNNLIRDGAKAVFSVMDILEGYLDKYGKYLDAKNADKSLQSSNNYVGRENPPAEKKTPSVKKKETTPVPEKEQPKTVTRAQLPDYASDDAKAIYCVITADPKTADELSQLSGMQIHRVLSALTELEMYSLVSMHEGKRYAII